MSNGLGRDHGLFTDTQMSRGCVWFHVVNAHVCFWCFYCAQRDELHFQTFLLVHISNAMSKDCNKLREDTMNFDKEADCPSSGRSANVRYTVNLFSSMEIKKKNTKNIRHWDKDLFVHWESKKQHLHRNDVSLQQQKYNLSKSKLLERRIFMLCCEVAWWCHYSVKRRCCPSTANNKYVYLFTTDYLRAL